MSIEIVMTVAFTAAFLTGCGIAAVHEGSATMLPGQDCTGCHKKGGEGESAFTAAGTVFSSPDAKLSDGVADVRIVLTDANGGETTLTSNSAGNFYTEKSLSFPLSARIVQPDGTELKMAGPVTESGCNSCHKQEPSQGAPGRIYRP